MSASASRYRSGPGLRVRTARHNYAFGMPGQRYTSRQHGEERAMLQSHLHSLIAKAHRYQEEPERFERISEDPLRVSVHGTNGEHEVVLREGHLECDCDGFAHRGEG